MDNRVMFVSSRASNLNVLLPKKWFKIRIYRFAFAG
jgi:hypothetical protein